MKKIVMIILLALVPLINATKFHGHLIDFRADFSLLGEYSWIFMLGLLVISLIVLGNFRKTIWGKIAILAGPLLLIGGISLLATRNEEGPFVFCSGIVLVSLLYSFYFFRKTGITGLDIMKYAFVIIASFSYSSVFYSAIYNPTLSWVDFGYTQLLLVVFCVYHLQGRDKQEQSKDVELTDDGPQVFRYDD